MPLVLDPESKFKVVLASDKDKPEGGRPAFVFRYPTGRQWRVIGELSDTLGECEDSGAVADQTFEAASMLLVGWENMTDLDGSPIPFDKDKLEDIIGIIEAQELIFRILRQMPDFEDKKKFDSPSLSDTEHSVKAASE